MKTSLSSFPRSATWLILLGVSLLGPAILLAGHPRDFPMDDAYIHFQYAQSLAARGTLEFNPGEFRGLGTTSLLWPLLLAGGIKLGIDPVIGANVLGILSLFVAALCVCALARPMFLRPETEPGRTPSGAVLIAGLFALSGNVLWFTLSGMETTMFLALGLLTLACYQRDSWWGVGVGTGLAFWCRPEGLVLAPTILLLEVLCLRRGGSVRWGSWLTAAVLAAVVAAPWVLYVHQNTGHWLPTTFAGKRIVHGDAIEHFLAKVPALGLWTGAAQPLFVLLWLGYVVAYVFGTVAMPGPALMLKQNLGAAVAVRLSVLGLALFAFVVIPLLVRGAREAARFLRSRDLQAPEGIDLRTTSPLVLGTIGVWVWALLHNLTYLVLLPDTGTATRYQAVNHLLLWWLVGLGLMVPWRKQWKATAAALAVALIVVADVGYWRGVFGANLDHMRNARIAAAEYMARELPPGVPVGAYDIGALRYFGNHPIIDLGGLTDTEFVRYQLDDKVDQYLKDRGAQYLALPSRQTGDAQALFEFATYLGLDRSPLFRMTEIACFEIDRDRWLQGVQATGNYQPSVRIFRLDWKDQQPAGVTP